ncbi:MAG TPA: PepSY-associated TM helix domain-containing protein [Candidatus Binatia bacterium]|nr:PepSY-associated TM helix domain-containing protein [Candidatus Binatia bacterium]
MSSDPAASVSVNLGRENTVFVNPYTGDLLGGLSAIHHFMHEIVHWHRWLGMEGEGRAIGKAITGACNLAFFWLAVTGVYLWWPQSWRWRGLKTSLLFNHRLSGKARDWNWHNDSLIHKACELREKTAHCNLGVILTPRSRWKKVPRRSRQQDRGDDRLALLDAGA